MAETKTKKLPENCSRFRSFVYRLVESKVFGAAILFVILSNTVVLIVNTSEEISVKGDFSFIIIYLIVYIVLENFIFLNLFVAVLVDNFQRTLTAAEAQRKEKSKHRTLFVSENDERETASNDTLSSPHFEVEEETPSSISTTDLHFPIIEDYYSPDDIPNKRDRELLTEYFTYLASLEYNLHRMHVQQRLLDELVDITVTIPDVPEELI